MKPHILATVSMGVLAMILLLLSVAFGGGAGRGMSRSSDVGSVGKAALYGRIIVGH